MADNNVASLFAGMDTLMKGARPDTGEFQSNMPPEGDYDCWASGITATPGKFRQKDKTEFDSIRVSFHYTTINPIPSLNSPDPHPFDGASFNIPKNPEALTEDGARTRFEMDRNRLAGHIKGILNREPNPNNFIADIVEVEKKLSGGSRVAVKVRVSYRKDNQGREWPTEKIVANIS